MNKEKQNELLEIVNDYINPGLAMHDGKMNIVSYNLNNDVPSIAVSFEGSCGKCPSSFKETLKTVTKFLQEESGIHNLVVENITEAPDKFDMKYVFNPEEE